MSKTSLPPLDVRSFEYVLKQRMKADPTFKDYDFEGSGLSAIIRLLSLDSNNLAFMSNMLFGESNLLTAQQRTNASLAAQFLSYVPNNKRCAFLYADIEVEPYENHEIPESVVLDQTATFVGFKDQKPFNFTVDTPVRAKYNADSNSFVFENVKLLQGTWQSKSYVVEGSAITPYQIPSKDVDINHLIVKVQTDITNNEYTTFTRYGSPYELGQFSNLFFVELGIDGAYYVEFGDGYVCRKVDDGNKVFITYLETKGEAANGIRELNSASSIGGFGRVKVTVKTPSAGGQEQETIEEIKRMAPLAFKTEGVAVIESDYESLTKRLFSNVKEAKAYSGEVLTLPATGFIFIAIVPHDGVTITDAEKAEMEKEMRQYNVGTISVRYIDADIYYVNTNSTVFWNPSQTQQTALTLQIEVEKQIRKWAEKELKGFSTMFDKQVLEADINDADDCIVSNITQVSYSKFFSPEIGIQQNFEFNYHRSLKEGSLSAVDFKPVPADVESTYFLKDDSGNIVLYRKFEDKVFPIQVVGSIDYKNGKIVINRLIVSKYSERGIELVVSPDGVNQNFIPADNQIVQINEVVVKPEVRQ